MNNKKFIDLVKGPDLYNTDEFIPLHAPVFRGNEKKYVNECIDSTFVSSVGKFVTQFEGMCAEYTGAKYAIAAVNGTVALHMALVLSGVDHDCEVITQPLTFIATTNAIAYTGAKAIFIDVDKDTMGLSPKSLKLFLDNETFQENGYCINKATRKRIQAVIPMHTFGFPCRIDEIKAICDEYNLILIEDAAESLGSFYKGKHTGTFGTFGMLSFNGNKTITCGGGGMILTDDKLLAEKAKHITTTAKIPHKWEYVHDMVGYNYRLANLNAALGCAQMEQLEKILASKRGTAEKYTAFFKECDVEFITEKTDSTVNYWLNAIILKDETTRNAFLDETNASGVMTRPIWKLMNELDMYKNNQCGDLANAKWLEQRVVNIPSSVI